MSPSRRPRTRDDVDPSRRESLYCLQLVRTGHGTVSDPKTVTQLLHAWREGDRGALDRLAPLIYDELHRLAERAMSGERRDHTLQPTALIHEAYLRLIDADVEWNDRVHFMATAASVMRRILVDHARAKRRIKRGGDKERVSWESAVVVSEQPSEEIVLLDDALRRLEQRDGRKAKVVELKYFGGLNYEETGTALGISPATVERDLRMAKAWLYRELNEN
jgi:RNA polymerase sigma factor (TIGR02999 family)